MPEFLRLTSPSDALITLLDFLGSRIPGSETIDTIKGMGRILSEDIVAKHPLPEFPRSAMDGYAVKASDTYGVSEGLPGYFSICGEVPMGAAPDFAIKPGTCAIIHTGGMLPSGADSVVMLENTQEIRGGTLSGANASEIEVYRPVAEGENVLHVGEDVSKGQVVIPSGQKIRPVDIGGCMALGIMRLRVAVRPRLGIVSSGDEVISPEMHPHAGQVRDINSYLLAALIQQAGGDPIHYGIVKDNIGELRAVCLRCLNECDGLVITAGSSASSRDVTSTVISSLGKPGVLVHGINIKPGKPTILAICNDKPVIGLPGNPVSAFVIAQLFLVPVINRLLGAEENIRPVIHARITINLPSIAGREDWIPVRLIPSDEINNHPYVKWLAEPVFGKSNLIFSLAAADGLIRIPSELTGISVGEMVEVQLI